MAKFPYSGPPLAKQLATQDSGWLGAKMKRSSVQAAPPDVLSMLWHGIELQKKGSLGLAAEVYQGILAKHPNNADALHLLGTVAMAGGQVDAALELMKRAVARKPADPSIRINLADALVAKNEPSAAEFHLRKALKLQPDRPEALCPLANCRMQMGDTAGAKKILLNVLARAPDHPQALIGYAGLCQTMGEIETAKATYRKALKEAPALALAGLASCEKLASDSPEATEIMQYLGRPGLKRIELIELNYAAAGIAEAAGEYDEAFSHFSHAKMLGAGSFDIDVLRRKLGVFKGAFTRQFFGTRAKYGHSSTRPVFVVGMVRSGTTLTQQIISRHPKAAGGGELSDIFHLALSLGLNDNAEHLRRLIKLTAVEAKELANRYLAALERISVDADRVVDKMPQNFLSLGLIALLFPKAKIVHCRRNPLDTCLSCFTMHLQDHNHGYTSDLQTLGLYYREYVSLMAHWREVLPLPIYDLDYEVLVQEPETETRKLIDFIGLPWDPACLTPHESTEAVLTLSQIQVRQPIYRTSVGRWRRYEKHLGPLKEALGDLVTETGSTPSSPPNDFP